MPVSFHLLRRLRPALTLGLLLALGSTMRGQLYWDVNTNATAGTGANPSGTWSTGTGSWNTNANGNGGSIVNWTNGNDAVFSAGTNGTGTYTVTVSGTVDVSSITIQEGTPTFTGGTIRFDSTPEFNVATNLTATVNSVIGDWSYSGLNKTGSGTLVLGGNNTFQAPVTVTAGTLTLAHNNALGTTNTWDNTIVSGGTLALQGNITVSEGGFKLNGTGTSGTGALRNVSGNNTLGGAITLMSDSTITSDAGTLTMTGALGLKNPDTNAYTNLTVAGAGNVTFSGAGYDSGSITKNGSGTLTFSGTTATSLNGVLNVNAGTVALAKSADTIAIASSAINIANGATLRLDANNQIADYAGAITVAAGGTFNVNGKTETIDSLFNSGTVALGAGTLTIGTDSGNSSLAGSVTGAGTLIKAGSGTLALMSSIVLAGELRLAGGTLALSGFNLTANTLRISGNSTIDFAGGNSTLSLTNFIVDAGVTLTITNWTGAADYFYTQGWTGATFNTSGTAPMTQVVFDGVTGGSRWQSVDKQITPVPEPSTYGLLMLLGVGGFAAWRRGRRA